MASISCAAFLLGVAPSTVQAWLEWVATEHRPKPIPKGTVVVVELDGMWHYLNSKDEKLWIRTYQCVFRFRPTQEGTGPISSPPLPAKRPPKRSHASVKCRSLPAVRRSSDNFWLLWSGGRHAQDRDFQESGPNGPLTPWPYPDQSGEWQADSDSTVPCAYGKVDILAKITVNCFTTIKLACRLLQRLDR